jgi:50S ribosomal subunit-associated GTPase HflX
VANKIDKLRQGERARLERELGPRVADALPFSATTGEGERALWQRLAALAAVR